MLGRLVSSSASIFSDTSFAPSAASLSLRRSAIRRKLADKAAQSELVAVGAESTHDRDRRIRQCRPPALGLARVDVRHVNFDERNSDSREGIANCETRVRICAGVDERAVDFSAHGMHGFDDLAFAVELNEGELSADLCPDFAKMLFDLRKRRRSIEIRFAHSEKIQVWAVDDGDLHDSASPSSHSLNLRMSSSDSCALSTGGAAAVGVLLAASGGVEPGKPVGALLIAPLSANAARVSSSATGESGNRSANALAASG